MRSLTQTVRKLILKERKRKDPGFWWRRTCVSLSGSLAARHFSATRLAFRCRSCCTLTPLPAYFVPLSILLVFFFGLYLSLNTSFRSLDPTSPLSVPVLCPCRPFVIVPFNKKKYSPTRIATSRPLLAGFPPATLLRNEHVG